MDPLRLEARFETANHVPAPYRHTYLLLATTRPDALAVSYQLNYPDRETLAAGEIEGEGFTGNDDFSWQGSLPAVWSDALRRLAEAATLRPPADDDELVLHLTQGSRVREGAPHPRAAWTYLCQELTQAIYEAAGREAPLRVRYVAIDDDGRVRELELRPSFLEQRLEVRTGGNALPLPWSELKPLLQLLYLPDYLPGRAVTRRPRRAGRYVDPGEGVWYPLPEGVSDPTAAGDTAARVVAALEKLFTLATPPRKGPAGPPR